jgi:hypothetical protein
LACLAREKDEPISRRARKGRQENQNKIELIKLLFLGFLCDLGVLGER